ncbi:glycosyltransferase [Mycobacterium sp. shizuoka-1]|uniref:glycosyltransferase n=1 Tax=Mycobacterium sp. shizuoka-1 TaxID=2039281 RepID=UPI000C065ACB|nr:glycosyltransferase [Mycobacterium sp. shizuoka-1]GAY16503.1 glycosyl transferase [Mycobacterium sp. shizuoka-1]
MSKDDRIAIAHDYLTQRGGAEKVVLALARAFPEAPIYTTLYEPGSTYPEFQAHDIRPSWLNRVALLRKFHRLALPLLAAVVGSTKINATHTIASSSGWAHGFRTSGTKIVYCYSPARWLYQPDAYLGSDRMTAKRLALKVFSPLLKRWDKRQAATATKYFAISTAVQQRIRETYKIEAEVLPAPHSIDPTLPQEPVDIAALPAAADGFYLCISRLLPYKNVDVVIDAFNELGLPLVVVGAGPEERRLRQKAGPSILMVKNLTDAQMRWLYAHCVAVLAASFEDFGLTPIEAATFGKPSIVLRWGGFLDTIREGETGLYFDQPVPELVREAVEKSRTKVWNPDVIRAQAATFSEERFLARLMEVLSSES